MQHVNVISCQLWPNEAGPGGQGPVVSADSLDRPVLCQPWIMDDGEPAGLTGNNSLPGGPTPFSGHDTTSQEMVRVEGSAHSLGAHILITHPLPLFHYPLQENRFLLAAQLPRVTSHDRNETRGATDRGLSQVQGQTKSHMSRMRR